jgi:hypothetical protein
MASIDPAIKKKRVTQPPVHQSTHHDFNTSIQNAIGEWYLENLFLCHP